MCLSLDAGARRPPAAALQRSRRAAADGERRDLGLQQELHAVHPALAVRAAARGRLAGDLRARLQRRGRAAAALCGAARLAAGRGRVEPAERRARRHAHRARAVRRARAAADGPDAAGRPLLVVPDDADPDRAPVAARSEQALARGARPRLRRRGAGQAQRPQDRARRAELGLHRHHRHDRVEHAAARALPAPLPPGSLARVALPQLLARRAHPALVRLHARLAAAPAADRRAPALGRVGPRGRGLPLAARGPRRSQHAPPARRAAAGGARALAQRGRRRRVAARPRGRRGRARGRDRREPRRVDRADALLRRAADGV